MPDSSTPDPSQCPGCGCNLAGLPKSGRCPECGRPYDTEVWAKFVRRPLFGRAILLGPSGLVAMVCIGARTTSLVAGSSGAFVVPLSMIIGMFWSRRVAKRVAEWRCDAEVANGGCDLTAASVPEYLTSLRRRYHDVALLAIFAAFFGFTILVEILFAFL
jgi:hypothetical protein